MKIHSNFVLALAISFGLTTAAHAFVTGSVSGPGGSGTVTVDSSGQPHVTKNFTNPGYLDLTIVVPANERPDLTFFTENITNSTGNYWEGFRLSLITSGPFGDNTIAVWQNSSFTKKNDIGEKTIDLSGGTVAANDLLTLQLGIFRPDPQRLGYTVTVRETPVPEPAPILLLASGGLILVAQRRVLRNRRAQGNDEI